MQFNTTDRFDAIYGLNIIYFFTLSVIEKIFALLKPGGKVILYMNGPEQLKKFGHEKTGSFYLYEISDITKKMAETDFSNIQTHPYNHTNEEGFFITGTRKT